MKDYNMLSIDELIDKAENDGYTYQINDGKIVAASNCGKGDDE